MPATTTVGQRFLQLIQQLGLTKNAFAQSIDKTATVIQHLVDERNKPGFDLLCKVFEVYPNVSKSWLLLGEGPMLLSASTPPLSTPAPPVEVVPGGIDLSDLPPATRRRTGTLLQPADIAATLALASHSPTKNGQATVAATEPVAVLSMPAASPAPAPAVATDSSAPAPTQQPFAAPAPSSAPSEVGYLSAALQAQHLQHQLVLAEQRNQHLQEQVALLKEMVALLKKE